MRSWMYKMKEFDYYIFIDYSENLIGYNIIEKEKIKELLPKISKLKHYKVLRRKKEYLNSMRKLFLRENINSCLLKFKINKIKNNLELFSEVLEFIKKNENCIVFVSIDDFQFRSFRKLIQILDGERTKVIKESQLKKGTIEYKMGLIIDTQLNLMRRKN